MIYYQFEEQSLNFPGGRIGITCRMKFISESCEKRVPCYRVLDDEGYVIPGSIFEEEQEQVYFYCQIWNGI